jgi:uncharacterized protein
LPARDHSGAARPRDAEPEYRVTLRTSSMLAGFQRWRSLLFVHWAVEPALLRPLVPDWLDIDTYGEPARAYIGLVPFVIPELRVVGRLPPALAFLETNLRTYVRCGGERGVWFFSLDASSTAAVLGARGGFGLPYFRAEMNTREHDGRAFYSSERRWPRPRPARLEVEYEIGEPAGTAERGSLEHFLVERYVLFAEHPLLGRIAGRVVHEPYSLRRATTLGLVETLRAAAGIAATTERTPDWWCEGLDVRVLPPQRLR